MYKNTKMMKALNISGDIYSSALRTKITSKPSKKYSIPGSGNEP